VPQIYLHFQTSLPQILGILAANSRIVKNVIVEIMESGVEHFIMYIYEYDIKLLGKCFYTHVYYIESRHIAYSKIKIQRYT
jgi:hypothetical protein